MTMNNGREILMENLRSKRWRLNNLYKIRDKANKVITFNFNKEQSHFFDNMHTRNLILKARQLGFTTKKCVDQLDSGLFLGRKCGMIADNKDSAERLFREKVKFAYDRLPKSILRSNPAKNDRAGELVFSKGGFVHVSTSMRSGTIDDLHVSEFGKICARTPEKAKEIVTGSFEAVPKNGIITIESTAEGASGYFYDYCMEALDRQQAGKKIMLLDWKLFFYSWFENEEYQLTDEESQEPISKEMEEYFDELAYDLNVEFSLGQKRWYQAKAGTARDLVKREYPATPKEAFEVAIEGAYYTEQFKKLREKGFIVQPEDMPNNNHVPVDTYWDLGVGDSTAIWFVRQVGKEFHIVDYYENSGEGLRHYFRYLQERSQLRGFKYGKHYAPHDIENRELGSDAKSRREIAREGYIIGDYKISVDFEVVPNVSIATGIEFVREILPHCVFDEYNCGGAIKKMQLYRKSWNDKAGVWRDAPLHDHTSHCADAFRYFAVAQNMLNRQGHVIGGSIF